MGWVALLGVFSPILAEYSGVLWPGCGVPFCWMGVLLVGARGLVVTCGVSSGVLVGRARPGRGAVPAWRCVPVAGRRSVDCVWRWAAACWCSSGWRAAGVPAAGLYDQFLCVSRVAVVVRCHWLAWRARFFGLGLLWFECLCGGVCRWVGSVYGCVGWCLPSLLRVCLGLPLVVWWLVFLAWGFLVMLRLVWGGPSSFSTGGPVVMPVGVALGGPVVVVVGVAICCLWPGLVWVLALLLLLGPVSGSSLLGVVFRP